MVEKKTGRQVEYLKAKSTGYQQTYSQNARVHFLSSFYGSRHIASRYLAQKPLTGVKAAAEDVFLAGEDDISRGNRKVNHDRMVLQ